MLENSSTRQEWFPLESNKWSLSDGNHVFSRVTNKLWDCERYVIGVYLRHQLLLLLVQFTRCGLLFQLLSIVVRDSAGNFRHIPQRICILFSLVHF